MQITHTHTQTVASSTPVFIAPITRGTSVVVTCASPIWKCALLGPCTSGLYDPVIVSRHVSVVPILVLAVAAHAPRHYPHQDKPAGVFHDVRSATVPSAGVASHAAGVARTHHALGEAGVDGHCAFCAYVSWYVRQLDLDTNDHLSLCKFYSYLLQGNLTCVVLRACLSVGCLSPSNMLVLLGAGSALTIECAVTLRQKMLMKLPTSRSHSMLTPGQPVLALTL